MRKILLLPLIMLLFSCQSEEEKLKEKIKPVISEYLLKNKALSKVDTIHIFSLEVINQKYAAESQLKQFILDRDFYLRQAKNWEDKAKETQAEAEGFEKGYTSVLGKELNKSFTKLSKKWLLERDLYRDSAKFLTDSISIIQAKLKSNKLDSVQVLGYQPYFRLIGADEKGVEIKRDSASLYISKSFNVLPLNTKF